MMDRRSPAEIARVQRRRADLGKWIAARLASGAKFPSTVVLAHLLGVSRTTAWKELKLVIVGWVSKRGQETPDAR